MSPSHPSRAIVISAFASLVSACLDTQVPLGQRAGSNDDTVADAIWSSPTDDASDDAMPLEACLRASPDRVELDHVALGGIRTETVTLVNCGTRAVTLDTVSIIDASDATFAVTDAIAPPRQLEPGASLPLTIAFEPVNAVDRSTATLRVTVDEDGLAPLLVPLSATARTEVCPSAIIDCAEGDEVLVQTTLHCSAYPAVGGAAIAGYTWRVTQPAGSAELIRPSTNQRDIELTTNIIGSYSFELDVVDSSGVSSCVPATYLVQVVNSDAIHVELLWHTPGDPDETDTSFDAEGNPPGSDLDLHFLHPNGSAWFEAPWDMYWFNEEPYWTQSECSNPRLDRDDADGAGPENLNLSCPEDGAVYKVGVHDWNDNGFGHAFATVRVYVFGTLRWEMESVELTTGDFWEVCTIAWPSGDVNAIATPPSIIANYPTPLQ